MNALKFIIANLFLGLLNLVGIRRCGFSSTVITNPPLQGSPAIEDGRIESPFIGGFDSDNDLDESFSGSVDTDSDEEISSILAGGISILSGSLLSNAKKALVKTSPLAYAVKAVKHSNPTTKSGTPHPKATIIPAKPVSFFGFWTLNSRRMTFPNKLGRLDSAEFLKTIRDFVTDGNSNTAINLVDSSSFLASGDSRSFVYTINAADWNSQIRGAVSAISIHYLSASVEDAPLYLEDLEIKSKIIPAHNNPSSIAVFSKPGSTNDGYNTGPISLQASQDFGPGYYQFASYTKTGGIMAPGLFYSASSQTVITLKTPLEFKGIIAIMLHGADSNLVGKQFFGTGDDLTSAMGIKRLPHAVHPSA